MAIGKNAVEIERATTGLNCVGAKGPKITSWLDNVIQLTLYLLKDVCPSDK